MNKYFVNDIGIWADGDRFIRDVLINGEYKFLYEYDTVVDLGANIGTFSLYIYPLALKIYSVEPNPKPMRLLQKTVLENNLTKIIPVEVAITGSEGDRFLKDTEDKEYGSGTINDKEGITVKGTTIDTFMVDNFIKYIDLLKIDVEGCEKEIFNSKGFENIAHRISTIIGEYHSNNSIQAELERNGFRYKEIEGKRFIARR